MGEVSENVNNPWYLCIYGDNLEDNKIKFEISNKHPVLELPDFRADVKVDIENANTNFIIFSLFYLREISKEYFDIYLVKTYYGYLLI